MATERERVIDIVLAERVKQVTPEVTEAIEYLDTACTVYCEWYEKGAAKDAAGIAYSLVSSIRDAIRVLDSGRRVRPEPVAPSHETPALEG